MEIDAQRLMSFALPILLAIVVRIIRGWKSRQEYAIRWVALAPTPVLDPPGYPSQATLGSQSVADLTRFSFILHNTGAQALDSTSIVEPLTWTGPGKVLGARVVATRPVVKLELKYSNDKVMITWLLFNQNCQALIEVLCDCRYDAGRGMIDGQIRNVSEIRSTASSYTDKAEAKRTIRQNIARSSRFPGYFQSEWLNLYLKLHFRDILFAIGVLYSIFFAFLLKPLWLGLGGAALIIIVLVWLLRNPYYRLLRHRPAGTRG